MEAAAAILLVGRTLTRGAPTCLRTAPLPRPVRPEPPLDADGHIVFCQHENTPDPEVSLYHKTIELSSVPYPSNASLLDTKLKNI
jgi:hypothetical protein